MYKISKMYKIENKEAINKLGEFLTQAKKAGYGFYAVTKNNDRVPKEKIYDVSGQMTWKQEKDKVIFFKSGIQEFEISDELGDFQRLASAGINLSTNRPAFHMVTLGTVYIFDTVLEDIWNKIQ